MWPKFSRVTSSKKHRGNPSRTMNVESQLALDEAVARALQYVEDNLPTATSSSETTATETVLQDIASGSANIITTNMAASQSDQDTSQDDIDPDNMTYEELQSLGESIGAENRGLSDELISYLESSVYTTGSFSSEDQYQCVICHASYENQEELITLPCKHRYHSHCIARWLRMNKVCPVCKVEVFGS